MGRKRSETICADNLDEFINVYWNVIIKKAINGDNNKKQDKSTKEEESNFDPSNLKFEEKRSKSVHVSRNNPKEKTSLAIEVDDASINSDANINSSCNSLFSSQSNVSEKNKSNNLKKSVSIKKLLFF
jgi:hypothetical protein